MTAKIIHGACLDVLPTLPDNSVDAVVTDPPYGLSNATPEKITEAITRWAAGDRDFLPEVRGGFMGKAWDSFVPPVAVWDDCMRVLKPGGHMVVFAGSRTFDLMALAIRLAGFEIRDSLAWLYGSGFPKSLDVSKAIDKRGGRPDLANEIGAAIKAAREARGWTTGEADRHFCSGSTNWTWYEGRKGECRPPTPDTFARIVKEWPELSHYAEQVLGADREVTGQKTSGIGTAFGDGEWASGSAEVVDITAPATPAAQQWNGWGTALKPAFEPVVLARKPLVGTVAANVLEHGTGALNIDGCRIGTDGGGTHCTLRDERGNCRGHDNAGRSTSGETFHGPNTSGGRWPANVILDESQAATLDKQSGTFKGRVGMTQHGSGTNKVYGTYTRSEQSTGGEDVGGASRFFYVAKAPKKERPMVDGIAHPTVKPLALMRWLVRLATPPGGTVLEPFAGSGTTVEAAILEGFDVVGIEREADYLPLIQARIDRAQDAVTSEPEQPDLFGEGVA